MAVKFSTFTLADAKRFIICSSLVETLLTVVFVDCQLVCDHPTATFFTFLSESLVKCVLSYTRMDTIRKA